MLNYILNIVHIVHLITNFFCCTIALKYDKNSQRQPENNILQLNITKGYQKLLCALLVEEAFTRAF